MDWKNMNDSSVPLPDFNQLPGLNPNAVDQKSNPNMKSKSKKDSDVDQAKKEKEEFQKTLDNEINKLSKVLPTTSRGGKVKRGASRHNQKDNQREPRQTYRKSKPTAETQEWTTRTFSDKQTSPGWETKVLSVSEKDKQRGNSFIISSAILSKDGKLMQNNSSIASALCKNDVSEDILCKDLGNMSFSQTKSVHLLKEFLPDNDKQVLMPIYVMDKNDPIAKHLDLGWHYVRLTKSDQNSDDIANNIVNHILDEDKLPPKSPKSI
eukprot:NODE_4_length_55019_cov_0.425091.p24 type:complete len:265 gc:universal NODE_4_length_55019_cov_0.425091:25012-24218(-)